MNLTAISTILVSVGVFMLANDDAVFTNLTRSLVINVIIHLISVGTILVSRVLDTVFIVQQARMGIHYPNAVRPTSGDDDHGSSPNSLR
jgi:hypothetical protein